MQESTEVREALLRFYERLSAGDVSSFDELLHKEDGRWKLLHGHYSVGVPDEEVAELQKRWEG